VAEIELRSVDKVYAGGTHAVRSLDLQADDGELLVLLGPSGCGKSTVLRLVAGLEALTSGEIRLGGRRIDDEPPQDRDVAMVFQSYALYGHMTVRENLEFPLRMRGIDRPARAMRAQKTAELLELGPLLDARPASLSGGQQQRVAMGRALVREPRAFLLDEPLSNLDARLRGQVRTHIAEIQRRLGVTTLYVTHDQVEALGLGHRIAVLRGGRLQQIGTGEELYDRPANPFVAQFLGQPGMNLFLGRVQRVDDGWGVDLGTATLRLTDRPELEARVGTEVVVGVRPESLAVVDDSEAGSLRAKVRAVESLGPDRLLYLASDVRTVDASSHPGVDGPAGEGGPLLAVRTGTRGSPPTTGDRVSVRVAPEDLRVF
jgi:multiple sugar transport system ATP-binding protein